MEYIVIAYTDESASDLNRDEFELLQNYGLIAELFATSNSQVCRLPI